jgi:hypothetical protein
VYIVNDLGDLLLVIHDLDHDAPNIGAIIGWTACHNLTNPSGVCFHPESRTGVFSSRTRKT